MPGATEPPDEEEVEPEEELAEPEEELVEPEEEPEVDAEEVLPAEEPRIAYFIAISISSLKNIEEESAR